MPNIPKQATKVFKGIIFDVYHYEQELYDGTTATFEMLQRPHSGLCIPIVGDKILLIKDTQPNRAAHYTFPGGQIEMGETPEVGAARELLEETGYASNRLELYDTHMPSSKVDWNIYLFIAHGAQQVAEPLMQPGERIEPLLVSFEECMDIVCSPEFVEQQFALDVLRRIRNGTLDELRKRLFQT